MDGVPGQIGTVLVGVLLLLSTSLLAPEQIFWLGLAAAAACVAIVIAIRRRYADALLRTLRSGLGEQILEGGPGLGDLLAAPDVRAALIAALHATDPGTREMAAVLLARSPEVDARQALAAALDDEAPAVRAAAAVAILGDTGGGGGGLEPERAESCLGSRTVVGHRGRTHRVRVELLPVPDPDEPLDVEPVRRARAAAQRGSGPARL